jgi:hypothetical protein
MTNELSEKNVFALIAEVAAELAKTGIAKTERNTQGAGFNYRGIDQVMGAASPIMSKLGLVLTPSYRERTQVERTSAKGNALFYTTIIGDFTFHSAHDDSSVMVTTYGEAMDSGNKSTNKAMSCAMKYCLLRTLLIPTEGMDDADATTHVVNPETDKITNYINNNVIPSFDALGVTRSMLENYLKHPLDTLSADDVQNLKKVKIALKDGAKVTDYFETK